jgi:hypothetical protein
MNVAERQMYRVVIQFGGKFAYVAATNMFMRADSEEIAKNAGETIFRQTMVQYGVPSDTPFTVTVTLSSESEVTEYENNIKRGHSTHRTLN